MRKPSVAPATTCAVTSKLTVVVPDEGAAARSTSVVLGWLTHLAVASLQPAVMRLAWSVRPPKDVVVPQCRTADFSEQLGSNGGAGSGNFTGAPTLAPGTDASLM